MKKNLRTLYNSILFSLIILFALISVLTLIPMSPNNFANAATAKLPENNLPTSHAIALLPETESAIGKIPLHPSNTLPKIDNTKTAITATTHKIVVNLAARELSFIENGKVIKSYPITIAAPKYAMPIEDREASHLIWNPSWTPPPSPWAAGKRPYRPGERGNPLGPMKIRIGGPYLIHGGGDGNVGGAVSHGCIRMRNADVLELSHMIIKALNLSITDEKITEVEAKRNREYGIKIDPILPVEIKYQSITINNNEVVFHPDLYRRGTTNIKNLRTELLNAGFNFDKLSIIDQTNLSQALIETNKTQKIGLNSDVTTAQIATAPTSANGR